MDPQQLVIDQALDQIEGPQPASNIPTWTRQGGASSPRCQARTISTIALLTQTHVARWKEPSASVLSSSPATVLLG